MFLNCSDNGHIENMMCTYTVCIYYYYNVLLWNKDCNIIINTTISFAYNVHFNNQTAWID